MNKLLLLLSVVIASCFVCLLCEQHEELLSLRQQVASQEARIASLEASIVVIDGISQANVKGIQDAQGKTLKLKTETSKIRGMAEETKAQVDDVRSDVQRAQNQIDAVQKRTSDLETAFGLPYEDNLTP